MATRNLLLDSVFQSNQNFGSFYDPLNQNGGGLLPDFNRRPLPAQLMNVPNNMTPDMTGNRNNFQLGSNAPSTRDFLRDQNTLPWLNQQPQTNLNQGTLPTGVNGATRTDFAQGVVDPSQPQMTFPGTQDNTRVDFTAPVVTDNATPSTTIPGQTSPSPFQSGLESDAEKVIRDMMSGAWTEPLRERQTEATARLAMQQRGAAGARVAEAGLTGQGIGAQALEGTEQNIRQQVADNILATEILEMQAKEKGVTLSQNERILQNENKWKEIDFKMNTDDYSGAAESFMELTGDGVDMSRVEDRYGWYVKNRDIQALERTISNNIRLIETGLLPDAAATALGQVTAIALHDANVMLVGDRISSDDWATIGDRIATALEHEALTDPVHAAVFKAAESSISAIEGMPEWYDFVQSNPVSATGVHLFDGSEEGTIEAGRVAAALSNIRNLSDKQRETLKQYDLYSPARDVALTEQIAALAPIEELIFNQISSGNVSQAKLIFETQLKPIMPEDVAEERDWNYYLGGVSSLVDANKNPIIKTVADAQAIAKQNPGIVNDVSDWNWDMTSWENPGGPNNANWFLTDDAIRKINTATGELFHDEDSDNWYILTGYWNPKSGDENKTGYAVFYDLQTGQTVKKVARGGGGSAKANYDFS